MELERVVTALAPGLLRFCIGVTGRVAEGEDLAQEALAALVRYWRANGPPDAPAAFAYTVARRQVRRLRWRRWRFSALDGDGAGADPAPDPECRAAHRERLARALAAMRRLSVRDREALLLAADADLGYGDAARVLGVSVSAFKMRVHRARARLLGEVEG